MPNNRVTKKIQILLPFINGWAMFHFPLRRKPGAAVPRNINESRGHIRVRNEIRLHLENLVNGQNLDVVADAINKFTPRPRPLLFSKEGSKEGMTLRWKKGDRVYRPYDDHGKITLNGVAWNVFSVGFGDVEARQFYYSLLRESIEDGTIERVKFCLQCKALFYQKSKKREFCRDHCRWTYNNHSQKRKDRYIKGVWCPSSKLTKTREPKPARNSR